MAEVVTASGEIKSGKLAEGRWVRVQGLARGAIVDLKARLRLGLYTASTVLSHLACIGTLIVVVSVAGTEVYSGGPRQSSGATMRVDGVAAVEAVKTRRVATETIVKSSSGPAAVAGGITSVPSRSPLGDVAASLPLPRAPDTTSTPSVETVLPSGSWSQQEVSAAAGRCSTMATAAPSMRFTAATPMRIGVCGDAAPVSVSSVGEQAVSLLPPVTASCGLAGAVDTWVNRVLQPAAKEILGSPVVGMVGTSSYVCRNRNGAAAGPVSEHAFANAFDVSAFRLADGRLIAVSVWGATVPSRAPVQRGLVRLETGKDQSSGDAPKPTPIGLSPTAPASGTTEASIAFLKRIHREACGLFGTVLGPTANDAHRDHLHFDMKARTKSFCE